MRHEAGDDLDLIAEIVPWSHGRENDFPVFHNTGTQTLGTEEQSIDREQQCGSLRWNLQMDLRVGAGEERASGIVHFNFDQQGPGRHVDVFSCAHQLSLKLASWELSKSEICRHTDFDSLRIFLRDVYVNP